MKITVLLPTLNESESIQSMIERVRKVDPKFEIVVVDSGSTDGTVEIAKKAGARMIHIEEKGKGLAIKKAFKEIDGEIAVLLDSDTSYAPEEIPKLVQSIKDCDVLVGSRFKGKIEAGSMKFTNKFGNMMLTLIAKILYWKNISDVCSGFWVFKKDAYKKMNINAKHFSLEANFYVECVKKKLRLCEVPISYGVRRGETKLNVWHGIGIGWYLLKERFS